MFKNGCVVLWTDLFFRKPRDTIPSNQLEVLKYLRSELFGFEFFDDYRFVEYIAQPFQKTERFVGRCNMILASERSAFRFADRTLVKITSRDELSEIAFAIRDNEASSVREHIPRAAELYSTSPTPDYRNSVKESISAVEAAVQFVTGKKTSGVARPLKEVADNFHIHPALRDGFEKLMRSLKTLQAFVTRFLMKGASHRRMRAIC